MGRVSQEEQGMMYSGFVSLGIMTGLSNHILYIIKGGMSRYLFLKCFECWKPKVNIFNIFFIWKFLRWCLGWKAWSTALDKYILLLIIRQCVIHCLLRMVSNSHRFQWDLDLIFLWKPVYIIHSFVTFINGRFSFKTILDQQVFTLASSVLNHNL